MNAGYDFPSAQLLVFCKAPHSGRVKTRLIPPLDAKEAARLHRRLALHTLRQAAAAQLCPLELWCAPDADHPFFRRCQRRFGLSLQRQHGADLGDKMHNALKHALSRSAYALLIGTDIPVLAPDHLRQAFSALESGLDAVVGPTEDGGYGLIGLRRPQAFLFQDMPWGDDRVMANTRLRLEQLRLRWLELPPLWDVDRPADLLRLMETFPRITWNIRSESHRDR